MHLPPSRVSAVLKIAQSVWDYEDILRLETDGRVLEQTICLTAVKHLLFLNTGQLSPVTFCSAVGHKETWMVVDVSIR